MVANPSLVVEEQQQSMENDAFQRQRSVTSIPVLEKGNPPANAGFWKKSAFNHLYQMAASHYLKAAFNQVASANKVEAVSDDPETQLAAKLRADRKAKMVKMEKVKMENVEAKDEAAGVGESTNDVDGELDQEISDLMMGSSSVGAGQGAETQTFFIDPLTDEVERRGKRLTRRMVWDALTNSTMQHHPYLMSGVVSGDIASFVKVVLRVVEGQDDSRVMAAVTAMVNLKKRKDMAMAEFVAKFSSYRHVISSSNVVFDVRLQREALLVCLGFDERYAIEVSLARRDDTMTTDQVIDSVLIKSRSVEVVGVRNAGLTGMSVDAGSTKSKSPCFNMRDNGVCKFGANCRYSHATSGQARTAKKASDSRARVPKTGCFECGEAHSITDCEIFSNRKANEAELKAELAAAKAMAVTVGCAQGTAPMSTISLHGPVADMASAVWGG